MGVTGKKSIKYFIFSLLVLALISVIGYIKYATGVSEYLNPEVLATHYNKANFVGSQTCVECHADIYDTHVGTAHFNTSAKANSDHIKGDFEDGSNELNLKGVNLKMIHENDRFYQLSKAKFGDTRSKKSEIDIVIGSGVKGQSHLSWDDNELIQLQASYFEPTGAWVNSPGFPDLAFKRPVDDNCLKCHVTFAQKENFTGNDEGYDRTRIILGIDCERCHGPLEKHVRYQRANPEDDSAKFVDQYSKYSRQQRLDACAVCHSGLQSQQIKGNPFSFLAGDTLALYSKNYQGRTSNSKLDVHGNQVGLLSESECFINSETLDCMTCHDPHKNQRGDMVNFNLKCLSCHTVEKINNVAENNIHDIGQNCISCHMPLMPSKVMKLQLEQDMEEVPVYIRTHLIGIYDTE